jgi:hypothetical protein
VAIEALTGDDIIALFKLAPHPEGGWYRQTFRDEREHEGRAHSTAILFLLKEGEVSRWHKVDAAELWHWHGGAPLLLQSRLVEWRGAACGGPGACLAEREEPRRLDAGRLHRGTRLPLRWFRIGARGLGTLNDRHGEVPGRPSRLGLRPRTSG